MNAPERWQSALRDLLATHESPPRPAASSWLARTRLFGGARLPRAPGPMEQRSLFGEILDWLFAPVLLLWPLSVGITFFVARSLSDAPFDRALIDRAEVLREQVRFIDRQPVITLPRAVQERQPAEDGEHSAYQIVDADGETLSGDPTIPRPRLYDFPEPGRIKLRTTVWHGADVRIAYTYVDRGATDFIDRPVLVQVAESLDKRTDLANEIIKGVIFPQFAILPLAIGLVWFGLARGLAPLNLMQQRIRARRPDDLSPIDPRGAPEEILPLVDAFNELLARQSQSIALQKRFIADAAHQMKTPLAGLRMQAELALRETDPNELRRCLEQIASSSERTAHLVQQLLSLARMENLRNAAAMEAMDLCPFAREAVAEWAPAAIRRGLDFGFESDDEPAPIAGHPVLLRELLNNLIDNALRYTPAGGTVTVRVRCTPSEALLEVEDDGVGIPPADRTLVFERFYRVLGGPAEGSGLGLPIVREIASQHHAQVSVEDGLARPADRGGGRGTRFVVRFPKADWSAH